MRYVDNYRGRETTEDRIIEGVVDGAEGLERKVECLAQIVQEMFYLLPDEYKAQVINRVSWRFKVEL